MLKIQMLTIYDSKLRKNITQNTLPYLTEFILNRNFYRAVPLPVLQEHFIRIHPRFPKWSKLEISFSFDQLKFFAQPVYKYL